MWSERRWVREGMGQRGAMVREVPLCGPIVSVCQWSMVLRGAPLALQRAVRRTVLILTSHFFLPADLLLRACSCRAESAALCISASAAIRAARTFLLRDSPATNLVPLTITDERRLTA